MRTRILHVAALIVMTLPLCHAALCQQRSLPTSMRGFRLGMTIQEASAVSSLGYVGEMLNSGLTVKVYSALSKKALAGYRSVGLQFIGGRLVGVAATMSGDGDAIIAMLKKHLKKYKKFLVKFEPKPRREASIIFTDGVRIITIEIVTVDDVSDHNVATVSLMDAETFLNAAGVAY